MKYCIIVLAFLFFATLAYSQEQESEEFIIEHVFMDNELKKREVKINLAVVQLGYSSIAYEQLFDKYNFALGGEVGTSYADVLDINFDYTVLPYARVYFGKQHNGFFIEANLALANFREIIPSRGQLSVEEEVSQNILGIGGALGLKYIMPNGLFGEIVFGVGDNTASIQNNMYDDIYLRLGLFIGKRLW